MSIAADDEKAAAGIWSEAIEEHDDTGCQVTTIIVTCVRSCLSGVAVVLCNRLGRLIERALKCIELDYSWRVTCTCSHTKLMPLLVVWSKCRYAALKRVIYHC